MTLSAKDNPSFQHILATTEKLIRQKGCRQTTLQDIIDASGLSKGAIYHYVQSKDELFGLILQSQVTLLNEEFNQAVLQCNDPLPMIAQRIANQTDVSNITSVIFTYLLSQKDKPKIASILQNLYQYTIDVVVEWIRSGQNHGVIPQELDAIKMATFLYVFSCGLRVQKIVAPASIHIGEDELLQFMARILCLQETSQVNQINDVLAPNLLNRLIT